MSFKKGETVEIDGLQVKITNPGKVLWSEEGYTKLDLIRYYIEAAPFLIRYLKNRPLVVTRYPNGINKEGFYQKNLPAGAPDWVETVTIHSADSDRDIHYILADNTAVLVWLGNQAAIELHPWLSSAGSLDSPDYAVFDLDPMEKTSFEDVRAVALFLRDMLESSGITGLPKTTGSTGIQIFIPIKSGYSYQQVRDFTGFFSRIIKKAFPDITTTERLVNKRQGKLYLDYLQNVQGKTLIAPFGVRPLPGAPISVTLTWAEVEAGEIGPQSFNLGNILNRFKKAGDPWMKSFKIHSLDQVLCLGSTRPV